ncbi:MAG: hypothetical protein J6R42_01285, partial [Clostridia bacterium]|nr:hypothetical protein [Clostridia bacterium]
DTEHLPEARDNVPYTQTETQAPAMAQKQVRAMLFATETCPNCRVAYGYLDKAGFPYEKLMASENRDLVAQYGIKAAPTLVLTDGESVTKYEGAGAIRQFLLTWKASDNA